MGTKYGGFYICSGTVEDPSSSEEESDPVANEPDAPDDGYVIVFVFYELG